MACNLIYRGQEFESEYDKPIGQYHSTIVRAIERSGEFQERVVNKQVHRYEMSSALNKRDKQLKVIGDIKAEFGDVIKLQNVLEKNPKTGRSKQVELAEVNVIPEVENLFHEYYADKRVRDENEQGLSQYQKVVGGNYDNIEAATAKADKMQKRFEDLGINTTVLLDNSLEASGELVGFATDKYKKYRQDGTVDEGAYAIVINPDKMVTDTVFHEFGHLMIDLLGGIDNFRVKSVYDQLVNSDLAKEVRDTYSDLSEDMLQKEIVAQALGKKADELFELSTDQSNWKKFLMWFKNMFNRMFNTDKEQDELTQLASQLVGNEKVQLTEIPINTTQQQRFKTKTVMDRDFSTLKGIRDQIYYSLSKRYESVKDKTTLEDLPEFLKSILDEMETLDNTESVFAVLKYLEQAKKEVNKLYDNLESSKGLKGKTALDRLGIFRSKLDTLQLIGDIQKSINSNELDKEFENLKDKGIGTTVEDVLNNTLELKKEINNLNGEYLAASRRALAELMAPYSNRAFTNRRDEARQQYVKENPKQPSEKVSEFRTRIDEYLEQVLKEEKEQLEQDNYNYIFEQLSRSSADISTTSYQIYDEKDINSSVVGLLSKIIDDADTQRNEVIRELKLEALSIYEDFSKTAKGNSPESTYKGLYNVGSDGNLYITSEYSPEFLIERKKLKGLALEKFDQTNLVDGLPIDKWKDKNYDKVKNSKIHNFLVKRSKVNDSKTQSIDSNLTQVGNALFIQAPNVGKSGFEELSSGSVFDNAWESIQRIYKIREDNTEFGSTKAIAKKKRLKELEKELKRRKENNENIDDIREEINMMSTLTNEIGDLKSSIPVFFRGEHNMKDQSYDLLSLMMMDSLMAENFYQKDRIKNTVEITKDIVADKTFNRTQGVSKKSLTSLHPGAGQEIYEKVRPIQGIESNEYKKIVSMVENRMYGVQNLNPEFGQLANTLMAWTATTMLGFNYLAASANVLQGKIYNLIEAIGGQWFDTNDLLEGEKTFWGDLGPSLNDAGRSVQTSKTHQMLDLFDVQGEFKALTNRFNEDARYKALMKKSSLFFMNHIGEFYIHGTLMYSILNRIKVKNAQGQYINKKNKVVKKAEAMSLKDAIYLDDNKRLQLREGVAYTDFGNKAISLDVKSDKGVLEIKNLINKLANDIHGQYNDEYQSHAQRYALMKMAFMLRKWIVRGFNRRWRGAVNIGKDKSMLREDVDKFYSEDLQSYQEGYYTSFLKFIRNITKEFKQFGLMGAIENAQGELSEHEISNVRKTVAELAFMSLSIISAAMLGAAIEDADDDDEAIFMYMAFYSNRFYSELTFFANPLSTFQILRSPAASASYVEDILLFLDQVGQDGSRIVTGEGVELYERGDMKGLPKMYKRFGDLFPGYRVYNRKIEDALSYVSNAN